MSVDLWSWSTRFPLTARVLAGTATILVALVVVAQPALAQETESEAKDQELSEEQKRDLAFDARSRVVEIQVPINVVARNGEPVRGLTAADFEILDNGRRQTISQFRIVDLELIQPKPGEPFDEEAAIPPAARRHFLFLFDMSFSSPVALVKAREAARDFVLESMHPTDLAAVAIHSIETGAQLIMSFSPDRAQLARAIDTFGSPRMVALQQRDPLRLLIDTPENASGFAAVDSGGANANAQEMRQMASDHLRVIGAQMAKYEKSFEVGRVSSWTKSMAGMARLFSSVEGRKQLVYFTEGFDGRLLLGRQPDAYDPLQERDRDDLASGNYHMIDTDDRFGNTILQGEINLMLDEFRRADFVIQAVDIAGLRADQPAEARERAVNADALFLIANETGGEVYEDANNFGSQLSRVLTRSSVTYIASFVPDQLGEPGERHKIKVRARAPKASRVSHRAGYYTPRPFDELHPLEKNLLASDLIASAVERHDIEMEVLAPPFRANTSEAYVPIIVELSGRDLLAGHEQSRLPVELFAYVTDDKGQMHDFFSQLLTLDLERARDAFANSGLKFYGSLSLEPGLYLVRVLARNTVTGTTGVQTVEVSVPVYAEERAQVLPPFFIEEPGTWFLMRQKGNEERQTRIYPFTVNGEPYVPAAVATLAGGEPADFCIVAYNLGQGELELESTVYDEAGAPVEGGMVTLQERTITGIEGYDRLTATFEAAGLQPGRYLLEVAVSNAQTREREMSSIPLVVR